jgi:energy-coupling factor transporter ATP-binding protein EcfA2
VSETVLKIDHLSYTYASGVEALKDVSLDIKRGEFVAIIGQNGSGKSTLLKNITGLLRPTSGKVFINGEDNKDMSVAEISHEIGFVLQNPDNQLFESTVKDEILYALKNAKIPSDEADERVNKAAEAVGVSDKFEEYPPALSKGDRAKVVIASVLAMNPPILILDEPTSGQDYRGCYQIMDIARRLHEEGRTIIYVTHQMPLVAEYADRTIVLSEAELMLDMATEEVFVKEEELAKTNILPPQITQLANRLRAKMKNLPQTTTVGQLCDYLVESY